MTTTTRFKPKPERGTAKRARIKASMKRDAKEEADKRWAKKRDSHSCRWPHTDPVEREACRRSWKEAAHFKSKGMGGDHGKRTSGDLLITFCHDVHQGAVKGIHKGNRRVVPLSPDCMSGPCAFEEKRGGRWVEVGREIHVGVLERSR